VAHTKPQSGYRLTTSSAVTQLSQGLANNRQTFGKYGEVD
jgi:hypothetical protein